MNGKMGTSVPRQGYFEAVNTELPDLLIACELFGGKR